MWHLFIIHTKTRAGPLSFPFPSLRHFFYINFKIQDGRQKKITLCKG